LFGDRKPFPFLETEFGESDGRFSPDGRWIAYTSDESGKPEVYVQPFRPGDWASVPAGKWQVSTQGGSQARWRRDGKEIIYRAPDCDYVVAGASRLVHPGGGQLGRGQAVTRIVIREIVA